MERIVRGTITFGSVLMAAGTLWFLAIWWGVIDMLPPGLDKPLSAFSMLLIGMGFSYGGWRLSGGGFGGKLIEAVEAGEVAKAQAASASALTPTDFRDMLREVSGPRPGLTPAEDPMRWRSARVAAADDGRHAPDAAKAPSTDAVVWSAYARLSAERAAQAVPAREHTKETPAVRAGTQFRIVLPPAETRSWMGGRPSMPADLPWPVLDGRPGAFLAQIALDDLSDETWDCAGPREGWLLVFVSADPSQSVAAIHTTEFGVPRATPEAAPSLFHAHSEEARLVARLGDEARIAPQWFLRPDDGAGPGGRRTGPTRQSFTGNPRLGDPALYPFDWTSAAALLDTMGEAICKELRRWEKREAPSMEEAVAASARDARMMTLARLRLLARETRARAQSRHYDEAEAERLLSGLAALSTEGWSRVTRARALPALGLFRGYRSFLEAHARRLYATAPESLPPNLRRALRPVWDGEAVAAAPVAGGDAPAGQVTLLELPAGGMTGWTFGEPGPLRVRLSAEALAAGDFAQAHCGQAPIRDAVRRAS